MAPPAFVIVRDILDWTRQTVAGLEAGGIEDIILVDNASTYPPLVEWLDASPHTVVRLDNLGKRGPWHAGIVDRFASRSRFIVTDPDVVPEPGCPSDWVDRFDAILDQYPGLAKVGFSLRIDDLPEQYEFRDQAVARQRQFWEPARLIPEVGYRSPLDTTMALYREGTPYCTGPAIRTAAPYVARHLAWYIDSAHPSRELRWYRRRAHPRFGNWAKGTLPDRIAKNPGRRIRPIRPST